MAEEKILIDVELSNEKVQDRIDELANSTKNLREEQKKLNEQMKAKAITAGQYAQKMAETKNQIAANEKQIKGLTAQMKLLNETDTTYGKTLNDMRQKLADAQKAYAAMDEEMRNSTAGEEFRARIEKLSDSVKAAEKGIGDTRRNVGNYPQAFKAAGVGVDGLRAKLTALMANPWALLIAAVAAAAKELGEAFKRNSDAMQMVEKAAAPFKAVLQSIQRFFDDIVKAAVDLSNEMKNVVGDFDVFGMLLKPINDKIENIRMQFAVLATAMTDVLKVVGFLKDKVVSATKDSAIVRFINEVRSKIQSAVDYVMSFVEKVANSDIGKWLGLDTLLKQLKDIAGAEEELVGLNKEIADIKREIQKSDAENLRANADAELRIAKLKAQAAEKDKYTSEQRLAMLQEASNLEMAIANRNAENARKRYELVKKENLLVHSNDEADKDEAEAYAAMVNAQTAAFNKQKELNSQMARFRLDIANSAVDNAEEAARESNEIQRMAEDFALSLIKDKNEKELAALRLKGQREIEDLKQRLETDKELTLEEKDQLAQLIRDKENKLFDDIADLQERQEEEHLQKLKELRQKYGLITDQEQMDAELAALDSFYSEDLRNTEDYLSLKAAIEKKYADKQKDLDDSVTKNKKNNYAQVMSAAKSLSSSLGEIAASDAATEEEAATRKKTASLTGLAIDEANVVATTAVAIANAIEGATKAGAETGIAAPFTTPAFIAEMVGIVGGALAQSTTGIISAKNILAGAFENGGIVPGTSYSGDKLRIAANSREMVLTQTQQKQLFDIANGQLNGGAMEAQAAMFAAAAAALPAPVMVYEEFNQFAGNTATYQEIAKV